MVFPVRANTASIGKLGTIEILPDRILQRLALELKGIVYFLFAPLDTCNLDLFQGLASVANEALAVILHATLQLD